MDDQDAVPRKIWEWMQSSNRSSRAASKWFGRHWSDIPAGIRRSRTRSAMSGWNSTAIESSGRRPEFESGPEFAYGVRVRYSIKESVVTSVKRCARVDSAANPRISW